MCRWVGYLGGAIRPEELLYETEHSLIHQSQASEFYENGVNADGLGLGWYGLRDTPGIYRNAMPAWGDRNLRELCGQLETKLFLAHIRATTGTPVQQTNCHPFRHGSWLFVHNGYIAELRNGQRPLPHSAAGSCSCVDTTLWSPVCEVVAHAGLAAVSALTASGSSGMSATNVSSAAACCGRFHSSRSAVSRAGAYNLHAR